MDEKDLKIQEQRAEIKKLRKLLEAAKAFIPHQCEFCIHNELSYYQQPCSVCTVDDDCFEWNGECCPYDV